MSILKSDYYLVQVIIQVFNTDTIIFGISTIIKED